FLGQPVAALSPCEGLGETLRLREQRAEVCPHQGVELLDGDEACGAAVGAARSDRLRFAGAEVVAALTASWMYRASGASQPAVATTDQSAQQVVVGGIVAAGEALVVGELGLHLSKDLGADHGGDGGHENPLLGWAPDIGDPAGAGWLQRGMALAGGARGVPP